MRIKYIVTVGITEHGEDDEWDLHRGESDQSFVRRAGTPVVVEV